VQQVDPHFKDEFTLGVDWSFHPDWAFKAKYVYWEQKDHASLYNQVDDGGNIIRVAEQNPYSESQRNALHLSVQRRFRDNWMVAAAYTWSETEGNCQESDDASTGCEGTGQYIDVVNPETGVPWSLENQDGPLATDRTHVVKLRGLYRLPVGKGHSLNLGAFFIFHSGEPWTRTEEIAILDGRDTLIRAVEPRGSHRNPDMKQLSLNLEWQFAIVNQLNAGIRLDVINVTNEQELIGTQGLPETGVPALISLNYQKPRYFRLMVRLTF
jgi:outer membrane receptor protein involved in Fe transport